MTQMRVLFASVVGEAPRSFLIAFCKAYYPEGISALDTIPVLEAKYGQATLYFADQNCPDPAATRLAVLKSRFPKRVQRASTGPIWNHTLVPGFTGDDFGNNTVAVPFRVGDQFWRPELKKLPCTVKYTLEWESAEERILLSGIEFVGAPATLSCVRYPTFVALQKIYDRFCREAQEVREMEPQPKGPTQ